MPVQKILSLILLFLLNQAVFSQATEIKTEEEISVETKKQAVEFLREAASEVGGLRTLENRISFASEMAGLMWFHDEREARAMMTAVVSDFRQLIMQYDMQINALGIELGENERYYGGFLGGGDQSEKAKLMRKLQKAMSVRQQIASSIAEHDPQLAFDFYDASLTAISNAQLRKQFEGQDSYFLIKLLNDVAEKDASKAAEMGRKSLSKGVNHRHLELLKKIYAKDAEKGAEFAQDLSARIKDEKMDVDNYYFLGSIVSLGAENFEKSKKDGKKPMFTEQTLRELTEILAQTILKGEESRGFEHLGTIEKYAPARAVQIRARFTNRAGNSNRSVYGTNSVNANGSVPPPPPPARAAPAISEDDEPSDADVMKGLENLGKKELSKEEREKAVAQARKIIAGLDNKTMKIAALSALAAQIFKVGDKELAAQVMSEAEALVNLQPKNYQDYMEVWMLASGYAQGDAEKAFPILDETIYRLNETLAAFIKVGEFIDVSGEMIEDGEVQVGAMGGAMVRDLTRGLGMADATLRNLAKADFTKTKNLANRFERPEIRLLGKMLVLRAVLGNKKSVSESEVEVSGI